MITKATAAVLGNERLVSTVISCLEVLAGVNPRSCTLFFTKKALLISAVHRKNGMAAFLKLDKSFFTKYESQEELIVGVETLALRQALRTSQWGNFVISLSNDRIVVAIENATLKTTILKPIEEISEPVNPPVDGGAESFFEPFKNFIKSLVIFRGEDLNLRLNLEERRVEMECGPFSQGGGYISFPSQKGVGESGTLEAKIPISRLMPLTNIEYISPHIQIAIGESDVIFELINGYARNIQFDYIVKCNDPFNYTDFKRQVDGKWDLNEAKHIAASLHRKK